MNRNVFYLGYWKRVCEGFDVPFIPSVLIGQCSKESLLKVADGKGASPDIEELYAKTQTYLKANANRQVVLRWDCCAGEGIKSKMAQGKPDYDREVFTEFNVCDCRLIEIVLDDPQEEIALWGREWIKPTVIDRYPVELRVFVRDGKIQGVSNYYPQRPLPVNSRITRMIDRSVQMTETLISEERQSFSLDFLCISDDLIPTHYQHRVMVLEGGPPHQLWCAHPCCFEPEKIDGIALTDRNKQPEPPDYDKLLQRKEGNENEPIGDQE